MIPANQLNEFIKFLTIPFAHLSFIDIGIIIVVFVYVWEGYTIGFIKGMADFLSFILSFIFGLTFYDLFGDFLVKTFSIPKGYGNALGFFVAALLCEVLLTVFLRNIILPPILNRIDEFDFFKKWEKIIGIFPGILSAVVLLAFVLTMIVSLPLSPFLKNSVSGSMLGKPLVSNISGLDKELNNVFGGAVNDALTFLTVEPKSQELLQLNFKTSNINTDRASEVFMLDLINKERVLRKIKPLVEDETLQGTARKHCNDMFMRGYFSHYTPEGRSPFDRMAEDDVTFKYAGENLALAPNTEFAMQGLMNSPGHKANILSKNFGKAGIGIIDSGIYGEMFCQEFID
ncbi:MAG: CvpA family protein [Patescibacteria group bacterium]|mgnify:FL=1